MPVLIDVPTISSNVAQNIVLDGLDYVIKYKFNSRDKRWRISIYRDNIPVIEGIKIMENQFLLSQYLLNDFSGDLLCFRSLESTDKPVTMGTLGINREYELVYYTGSEIQELIDD